MKGIVRIINVTLFGSLKSYENLFMWMAHAALAMKHKGELSTLMSWILRPLPSREANTTKPQSNAASASLQEPIEQQTISTAPMTKM